MNQSRPPFWYPTANYYVLAIAFSTAVFFTVWGLLRDEGDETPWITAGISSSVLVGGAVVLRGMIVRRFGDQYSLPRVPLEDRFSRTDIHPHDREAQKLTVEKNAAILAEIRKKSDAARVLSKMSAGHREVFELCREYLDRSEAALRNVSPSSPRLPALLKGRSTASELHRYHLLKWAAIESQNLAAESQTVERSDKRIRSAVDALKVIESALAAYPSDESLLASKAVLEENVVFVRVADGVEKAERAAFDGDFAQARMLYRDALFELARDNGQSTARSEAADRIRGQLERIGETGSSD